MSSIVLKQFYKKYKFHLIVWGVYIIYEVFITGLINRAFGQPGVYVMVYSINIISFYAYAYLLNKTLDKKNKFIKILNMLLNILIIFVGYALSSFTLRAAFVKLNFIEFDAPLHFNLPFILACLWRSLYFIGFSTGYVFIMKSFRDQKRSEELERRNLLATIENQTLEKDLVNTQNNYLRSQINPHFLFNTLNFIYNDARKKAPIAAEAIMDLAEMMRYALKRPEVSDLVPLADEIEQVEHLINLHKLRTANAINFNLEVEGDIFGVRFPPLILLTLAENMFKHGHINHGTHNAVIRINFESNLLIIETVNMTNSVKAKESTNLGVENIQKRLAYFYKDDYTFTYGKDELNRYISKITVKI
ncbi:histidine kinase [Pedobacter changchengzhani]|uniref:Histidine kinase n=1 Tax=Pedobacter changchengzhani TaxID=2529274 RepID=A0A4R5MHU4_9SPHI|nr:histidine kinase [Pedobacter changchengzhani]TDG34866.1 histidine kinase [Pedobacter changchengzhani]